MHRSPLLFDWHQIFNEVKVRGQFDSDAQLADYLGLTRAQISAWRTGKSALGTLTRLKLLDALGHDSLRGALHSLYPAQERDDLIQRQVRLVARMQPVVDPSVLRGKGEASARLGNDALWRANMLLAALPDDERAELAPHVNCVSLPLEQCVYGPGDEFVDVYFPTTAVLCVTLATETARPFEMAVVGGDGLVGPALFPGTTLPAQIIVQHAGQAVRLSAPIFRAALARGGVLRRLFFGYAQVFSMQLAQSAHCAAHHATLQRLCRWLLLSVDRTGPMHPLPAQPDWLASQLGAPEASVRDALAILGEHGAITCQPAGIQVLNRARVERAACGGLAE
jgi:transcriptional regulator with XRE-family HTH domain